MQPDVTKQLASIMTSGPTSSVGTPPGGGGMQTEIGTSMGTPGLTSSIGTPAGGQGMGASVGTPGVGTPGLGTPGLGNPAMGGAAQAPVQVSPGQFMGQQPAMTSEIAQAMMGNPFYGKQKAMGV